MPYDERVKQAVAPAIASAAQKQSDEQYLSSEAPKEEAEFTVDEEVAKFTRNKSAGYEYQKRRHPQWTENYTLYRDTVIINRLTQRQSINVPLMKESIKTSLSRMDESVDNRFKNKNKDEQKDIFINEYWKYEAFKINNLDVADIVDKKQQLLYGRSFIKLYISGGHSRMEVIDPWDILIDHYTDPANLETANFLIHQHIYRSLEEILENEEYDQAAKDKLRGYLNSKEALIKSQDNQIEAENRNERLKQMGDTTIDGRLISGVIVELNEHYYKMWDDSEKGYHIHLTIVAEDNVILYSAPLMDCLGVDFYPFVTWADDVEKTDFWSDGMADVIRVPNRVVNAFVSQLAENRTLRNYGMRFFNSAVGENGWTPAGWEPKPFGLYPVPGNPKDIIQEVTIPDLSESLDEIQFLIGIVERATAATRIQKGETEKGRVTLGEVKIAVANALERLTSIAKFYRLARKELGEKWVEMIMANADKLEPVRLFKKSSNGKYYEKEVKPSDWQDKAGYICEVVSSAEQDQESGEMVTKLMGIKSVFPNNKPLDNIVKKHLLEYAKLAVDEVKQVMDFEEKAANTALPTPPMGSGTGATPPSPVPGSAGAEQPALIPNAQPV